MKINKLSWVLGMLFVIKNQSTHEETYLAAMKAWRLLHDLRGWTNEYRVKGIVANLLFEMPNVRLYQTLFEVLHEY